MPRKATVKETVDVTALNKEWPKLPAPLEKEEWAREYGAMVRHTQGKADDKIITTRRPYEPEEIKAHRVANFRAVTKSAMNRAIYALQRLFSKANVDVNWPEQADEFLNGKNFDSCDFLGYVNKHVVRRMIEDANGLLVWWSDTPDADNVRVAPRPILLLSENIIHHTDEMLTFLSDERSAVTITVAGLKKEVMEGDVWYILTRYGYYRREQYGDKGKPKYRIVDGYAHKLGYVPAIKLGGEEMLKAMANNRHTRWLTSYFSPCVEYANEALAQFSDHQAIMVTAAHPIREMERLKCTHCSGKGKTYAVKDGKEEATECTYCKGEKTIVPSSPHGVLWRKSKRAGFADEPTADPVPMLRYISPDVAIVEYSGKHWRELLQEMEKALHLLFIDEAQSGVAKEHDREDKVSTLDRIGQNVFEVVVAFSLKTILSLMKITPNIVINMPSTFVVRSEEDLRKEILELSTGGILPLYRAEALMELIRKRFPNYGRLHHIVRSLAYYDLAFGYTAAEKSTLAAQGFLSEELVQRSAIAEGILNRFAQDKGDAFMLMSMADIAKQLDTLIAAELAARPVIKPEPENAGFGN